MYILAQFRAKLDPVVYARSLGVKLGSNVRFLRPGMFSTEPWLITIGNNVHIANGCQYVAHDGEALSRHVPPRR